jgi:circadian clock protein KaiB
MRARSNLAEIAQEHLAGNFTIEEVDVLKNPRQALADHILVTPTLLLLGAESPVRIIGNLNEREKVLNALGI